MFPDRYISKIYFIMISFGLLSFIYNIYSKNSFSALLFLFSIILMVTPTIAVAFSNDFERTKYFHSFLLLIIPVIALNYSYNFLMGSPVGFQDMHDHIFEYSILFDHSGHILFSNAEALSFNFVSLYVIFRFLESVCSLDIISLSLLIPPFFNVLIVLSAFILISKIHSQNVALVAALLIGWDYEVLIFGREMRTQTIGTIFLFMLMYIILSLSTINNFRANKTHNTISKKIILILILAAIAISSFVGLFFTFMVLIGTIITIGLLTHILKWPINIEYSPGKITLLIFIFMMSYIMYVSKFFKSFVLFFYYFITSLAPDIVDFNIWKNHVSSINSSADIQGGILQDYGTFAGLSSYLLILIFIIACLYYMISFYEKRNLRAAIFFGGFGFLIFCGLLKLGFEMFFGNLNSFLSIVRFYIVFVVLVVTVISFALTKAIAIPKIDKFKSGIKLMTYLLIIIFIMGSVIKNPSYIVGGTSPIRSAEPIDSFYYWNVNYPQYSLDLFISNTSYNHSIFSYMLINDYAFLKICRSNGLAIINPSNKGILNLDNVKKDDLIILHDKFNSKDYSGRNYLPKCADFFELNKIYSNMDYNAYKRNN